MQPRDLPHICASLVLVAHIAASTAVRIFETTKVISKRVIPKFQLLRAPSFLSFRFLFLSFPFFNTQ